MEIDRYVAYEVDKYAIKVATHNFPDIEEKGDVFKGKFTEYAGFDYVIGGSPCTYWSIAQKNNRETEASGMGWELFQQYVRAVREAKPKYFIYENNKSMSKAIRQSITDTFGFEPICINSALVSAQNRQRLYWVGARNEDGTYSKVYVEQPEDRGILLKDILEKGNMIAEPVNLTKDDKSYTLSAQYYKCGENPFSGFGEEAHKTRCAEPVRVGTYPQDDGAVCESKQYRVYSVCGKSTTICGQGGGMGAKTGLYALPVVDDMALPFCRKKTDELVEKYGYLPEMFCLYNRAEIKDRSPTLTSGCSCSTTSSSVHCCLEIPTYAVPTEWDGDAPIKAISLADGKVHTVYQVKGGKITIRDKQYPIKLSDGYYIIRKLTVRECMRLQTVPEWYNFSVISPTQAYKCLGNGWTCSVITHLINATIAYDNGERHNDFEQIKFF